MNSPTGGQLMESGRDWEFTNKVSELNFRTGTGQGIGIKERAFGCIFDSNEMVVILQEP